MQYKYTAYNLEEGVIKGSIEARNLKEAHSKVTKDGFKPLIVSKAKRLPSLEDLFPSLFRVTDNELVRFCRYISAMLISGGSLLRVLGMLETETKNRSMRNTLEDIRLSLDEGTSLSAALRKHPLVFNPLFVSVVEVGEYTGRLGPALDQMADILERSQEAKQKAIRTLMYPVAIVGLAVVTLGVLMTIALPPMLKVFERMGADLPFITRVIVAVFNLVREKFIYIAIIFLALGILVFFIRRVPFIKYRMDLIQYRVPFIGPLIVSSELARLSRTMAMLLNAGVGLATALRLGTSGIGNLVIKRALLDAEESLMTGHGLTSALKKHPVLPSMFIELVMIGEESNSLKITMSDAANAYQKQMDNHLNKFLGMLEPASTLLVGGVVGLIAFSMFVPIYSGLNAFK